MTNESERVPFWLVALVAGVATFALVAIVGVLLVGGHGRRAPAPEGLPPELAMFHRGLAEYILQYGTLPKGEEVAPDTWAIRRPATTTHAPGASSRPNPPAEPPASRPAGASAGP